MGMKELNNKAPAGRVGTFNQAAALGGEEEIFDSPKQKVNIGVNYFHVIGEIISSRLQLGMDCFFSKPRVACISPTVASR